MGCKQCWGRKKIITEVSSARMNSGEDDLLLPGISPNPWKASDSAETTCPSCHSFKAWISEESTGKKLQAKENQVWGFFTQVKIMQIPGIEITLQYTRCKPGYEAVNKGVIKKNHQNPKKPNSSQYWKQLMK